MFRDKENPVVPYRQFWIIKRQQAKFQHFDQISESPTKYSKHLSFVVY